MVRHTDDNDKKPGSGQGDGPRKPEKGSPRSGGRAYAPDKGARPAPRAPKPERGAKGAKPPVDSAPKRSERIAKVMARAGVSSRREVERLIGLGKVALNGRILDTPATLVTRDDVITVDGKPIGAVQSTRVWRYHKPVGLLTSHNDPAGRPTVFDALPAGLPRVISVGRLDINSEGLLLLTNDGELSRALELPASALVRQYRARARGRVTQAELDKLKDGVTVDGVQYGSIEATLEKAKETLRDGERGGANLWISVTITEGKNREVRKVLESLGLAVNRLIRLAYGPFQLGTLAHGDVEEVGPRVIREMLAEHIRPDNLPTGNTVATPAPIPGRRSSTPIVKGRSGSAMSDPSRKPSRVRAATAAAEEGAARAESGRARGPKKEGWAKAAPRTSSGPGRPAAPRGDRPTRDDGDRPKRPFKPREGGSAGAGGDRPQRDFKPRAGASDRPRAPYAGKSDGPARDDGDRPKRPFKPRAEGAAPRSDSDRPKRDFKPRSNAAPDDAPRRDSKSRAPTGKPGSFGAKPAPRSFGGKPSGPGKPRPGGPRPTGPRGPRSGS